MSIEAMKQARAALEDVITQIKYYEQGSEAIVALNRAIEHAEKTNVTQKLIETLKVIIVWAGVGKNRSDFEDIRNIASSAISKATGEQP